MILIGVFQNHFWQNLNLPKIWPYTFAHLSLKLLQNDPKHVGLFSLFLLKEILRRGKKLIYLLLKSDSRWLTDKKYINCAYKLPANVPLQMASIQDLRKVIWPCTMRKISPRFFRQVEAYKRRLCWLLRTILLVSSFHCRVVGVESWVFHFSVNCITYLMVIILYSLNKAVVKTPKMWKKEKKKNWYGFKILIKQVLVTTPNKPEIEYWGIWL